MNPFVAEIRIWACNFAPNGWARCDGQLLPLSQNTALFSLLGTTYGGNGISNFALPNLQGGCTIQQGQGPGLSYRDLGQQGGSKEVALLQSEMPAHTHINSTKPVNGTTGDPAGNVWGITGVRRPQSNLYSNAGGRTMSQACTTIVGTNSPHNNLMPYQTFNYCIARAGVFPPRP